MLKIKFKKNNLQVYFFHIKKIAIYCIVESIIFLLSSNPVSAINNVHVKYHDTDR